MVLAYGAVPDKDVASNEEDNHVSANLHVRSCVFPQLKGWSRLFHAEI